MGTYGAVTLLKITNDADGIRFHGYTTTSLSSRGASLKSEATNPRYTNVVHVHIRKLGKELFKISLFRNA